MAEARAVIDAVKCKDYGKKVDLGQVESAEKRVITRVRDTLRRRRRRGMGRASPSRMLQRAARGEGLDASDALVPDQ
jgi:hypothetical protein